MINGLLHIVDDTISDDQANVVLLIHLVNLRGLHLIVHLVENLIEVGRSIQISVLQCFLVMTDNFCDSVDSWIEDVSVQCKAMGGPLRVWRNRTAKAVQIDHFVTIVKLQDITDSADSVKILVALRVEVVKGMCVTRVTV